MAAERLTTSLQFEDGKAKTSANNTHLVVSHNLLPQKQLRLPGHTRQPRYDLLHLRRPDAAENTQQAAKCSRSRASAACTAGGN
jgi:hypothetical protein